MTGVTPGGMGDVPQSWEGGSAFFFGSAAVMNMRVRKIKVLMVTSALLKGSFTAVGERVNVVSLCRIKQTMIALLQSFHLMMIIIQSEIK